MVSCILRLYHDISTDLNDRLTNYSGVFKEQKRNLRGHSGLNRGLFELQSNTLPLSYTPYRNQMLKSIKCFCIFEGSKTDIKKATFDCCIAIWIAIVIHYEAHGIIKLSSKDITFQWHYLCIANIFKKWNMRNWAHISFNKTDCRCRNPESKSANM